MPGFYSEMLAAFVERLGLDVMTTSVWRAR
jgi:hypothetical protein